MGSGKQICKRRSPYVWTPERVTMLTEMHDQGVSDEQIAVALGHGFNQKIVESARWRFGITTRPLIDTARKPSVLIGKSSREVIDHLMKKSPAQLTPAEASLCHLIDLKRAGHSASMTEERIEHDGGLPWRWNPPPSLMYRSPAAALVEG